MSERAQEQVWLLSLDECPSHGYRAVSLQEKGRGGLRLTRGKCCGSWRAIKSWRVDPIELAAEILSEARNLTQEQRFDLEERLPALVPYRDESFTRRPR